MNKTAKTEFSNAFFARVDDYRVKIDNAILAELDRHKESVFYVPVKMAMKGGKRLRPVLLLLSFENVGGRELDPFPAAAAVELAHLESLIHDDIIDRDFLRRDTVAFHVLYGYELALLSADFILSVILDIGARYADRRIVEVLASATSRMCEGQLEELTACKEGQRISIKEYVNIVSKKTASLFEASAAIGAIIGGAEEEEVKALSNYGRLLGIAYQIRDDLGDLDKSKTNNILTFLEKIEPLQAMSDLYLLEAKNKLGKIKVSKAKTLLMDFADYLGMQN